ncbi:unnamed protein product [Closterium sp. NIES-53]
MATPRVLTFDAEGRAVDFEVWVDDLQLFLQCDRADGLSLFDLTSGLSPAPPATADSTVRSQWATRDATARLAVRRHLPTTERAHFSQYRSAQTLYDAVVVRYSSPATAALSRLFMPYLFPDLAAFPTVADLITHLRTSDARYHTALPAEDHFLSVCPTTLTVDLLEERLLAAEQSIVAGIRHTFTLPASPQQNGIAERRIGMVMDVARTSMIHAAAPHFLWPFAIQYAAHQLNLQPRVSLPETSPTLLWTGKVGDASAFRVWGSRAFVHDLSADKLSPRAVPCVFLGFPPDAPGWQFYHPTSRRVLSSQDVTFDESVPYYRLFPYRTASLPPPPLFLAPGHPPVDPLPPQGPAPSGVSQVDAVEPVEVAVDSGAAPGAEPAGAGSGGAESGGAETWGAEPGGAEPGGAEPGGAEPRGAATGEHMAAAKRVLRYLCSTSGMGLVLGGRRPVVLTGHADASWADDQATQRSSQGYTFSLGSGSVSWRSTRSSSVLSSSCEAEIYAGAMAAQELRWLTYLLTDLGEQPRSPPVLYVDNKAMLALCREHRLEHRTKHIALRYFLARELQQRGQLRLAYVASEANTADIFTKALAPGDHQRFCTLLGLVPTWPHLLTS